MFKHVFFLLIFLFLQMGIFPKPILAANCSLVETDPNPIYTESDNATFKIDVGNNNEPGIAKWKMEFKCGGIYQQPDAIKNPDSKTISATIRRQKVGGSSCEFSEEFHNIQVKAINTEGNWLDWCNLVSYKVTSSDAQCKLSIDPPNGLTINSKIKVSGENLTKDGQFKLFIDDDKQIMPALKLFLETDRFSGIEIPPMHLSPVKHRVYIKRYNIFALPTTSNYGPPLCPLEFTIGPATAPGSVMTTPTGGSGINSIIPAFGGGEKCGTDASPGIKADPGIKTAIGCIHTSPAAFVKDLVAFTIGISGGLAFLMMLMGVFQMLTSAGNPDTLTAGKDKLTNAIIGLLFVIFSILLLQIIGVDILGIPGFGR